MNVDFGSTRVRPSCGSYAVCETCTQTIPDLPEDASIDPGIHTYCSERCVPKRERKEHRDAWNSKQR